MPPSRYAQIIEAIFFKHYQVGMSQVLFDRADIVQVADELGIALPKNIGDVIYSFRYRAELPSSIVEQAKEGYEWIIRPAGRAKYKFELASRSVIEPSKLLVETKIPDATPGIIGKYALNDEQALLAKIRYNRLVDLFTGLVCYSLQNHLRTAVRDMGQVETDEIYLGIDKRGVHYVLPVEAKGKNDKIGLVQIEQDLALCTAKFPGLLCRPIAAQLANGKVIALFEFEQTEQGIAILAEKHYRLVRPEALSAEELAVYQHRPF